MGIAGIAMVAICICALEMPRMWRKREYKELWLFSAILALGTVTAVGINLNVDLPNPMDWFYAVFRPVGSLVESLLGTEGGMKS